MIEALTPIFVRYGYPFSLKSDNAGPVCIGRIQRVPVQEWH